MKTLEQILREEYGSEVFDHLKKQWKKVARKWLQQKQYDVNIIKYHKPTLKRLLEELEQRMKESVKK